MNGVRCTFRTVRCSVYFSGRDATSHPRSRTPTSDQKTHPPPREGGFINSRKPGKWTWRTGIYQYITKYMHAYILHGPMTWALGAAGGGLPYLMVYWYVPSYQVYIPGFVLLVNPLPWMRGWVFVKVKLGLLKAF
jgi:hypothetical protein